jgi:hypothetical protein
MERLINDYASFDMEDALENKQGETHMERLINDFSEDFLARFQDI